ncbi:MAG: hypothetical protein ACM31C_17685 [Acidobacteriota bacterium]
MTVDIDVSQWTLIGETLNSKNYAVEPNVLAVVPHPGAHDTGETAHANIVSQAAYLRPLGGGVVVIFFDNLASQDKDARRVYQAESNPDWMRGTALIGGSMLSRAIGSFFLGLSRPRTPVRMFGSFDDALAWSRELNGRGPAVGTDAP